MAKVSCNEVARKVSIMQVKGEDLKFGTVAMSDAGVAIQNEEKAIQELSKANDEYILAKNADKAVAKIKMRKAQTKLTLAIAATNVFIKDKVIENAKDPACRDVNRRTTLLRVEAEKLTEVGAENNAYDVKSTFQYGFVSAGEGERALDSSTSKVRLNAAFGYGLWSGELEFVYGKATLKPGSGYSIYDITGPGAANKIAIMQSPGFSTLSIARSFMDKKVSVSFGLLDMGYMAFAPTQGEFALSFFATNSNGPVAPALALDSSPHFDDKDNEDTFRVMGRVAAGLASPGVTFDNLGLAKNSDGSLTGTTDGYLSILAHRQLYGSNWSTVAVTAHPVITGTGGDPNVEFALDVVGVLNLGNWKVTSFWKPVNKMALSKDVVDQSLWTIANQVAYNKGPLTFMGSFNHASNTITREAFTNNDGFPGIGTPELEVSKNNLTDLCGGAKVSWQHVDLAARACYVWTNGGDGISAAGTFVLKK